MLTPLSASNKAAWHNKKTETRDSVILGYDAASTGNQPRRFGTTYSIITNIPPVLCEYETPSFFIAHDTLPRMVRDKNAENM
jgi:hypothetical protein